MIKYMQYNKIVNLWNDNFPFKKFCLIGVTNVVTSYTIYYILLTLGVYYLVAIAIAYFIGILNGNIWSSKFVFNKNKSINNMMKFFIVYISALFINLGIMYFCVDTYNMNKLIDPIFCYRSRNNL